MLNSVIYPAPNASPPGGPGQRIVLVHGFTQNAGVWRELAELLNETHEVIAVDLPGHGQTDSQYDQSDLWAAAQLVTEAGGSAIYVGYSLGARVVLHAVLANSDQVQAAVLIGGKAGFRDDAERNARILADNLLADRIESLGDERYAEFIDDWLAQEFYADLHDGAKQRDLRLRNRAMGVAASLRNTGSGIQLPLWDRLESIEMPILIVKGEHDLASVEDEAEDMKNAIGDNATFTTALGTGHASPFENPTLIANIIEAFVTDIPHTNNA